MIRYIKNGIDAVFESPMYIRLMSYFSAYGTGYNFAEFWIQYSENKPVALISCIDSNATVVGCEQADFEEIAEFLCFIGATTVLSDIRLGLKHEETNNVYVLSADCRHYNHQEHVNYKQLYNVFQNSFEMPDYNAWYVDVCHRIRHKTAFAISREHCGLFAMLHDGKALISGVAVNAECRKHGFGFELIKQLICNSGCSKVYALSERSVSEFYLKNGFTYWGCVYKYIMES